jgi:Fic family protein
MSQFSELLARIVALKAELDSLRPLDHETEERILQKFRLWWTYHSNAIEGNKLTQGETEMFLMEGLTAKGKPLKDHLDLQGHSNAINFLLAFIREKEVLTEAVVRKLHEVLLVKPYQVPAVTSEGIPTQKAIALGEYKTHPNHVHTPTGEIHYFSTPLETPLKMGELVAWHRSELEKPSMSPIEVAARFHHQFTAIHPFDDGNGRMARLLMNLLLMQQAYPPVVIRISERDAYLMALRKADGGDSEAFCVFVAEHVVSSIELYLRAAKGEEIHEPTDLEKEITLLRLELEHIEEPEALTQDRQKSVFERSLDPLFMTIKKLLTPLSALFAETFIGISGHRGNKQTRYMIGPISLEFGNQTSFPRPPGIWEGDSVAFDINFAFQLKGFKKGRFDAFDITPLVQITFQQLNYSIQLQQPQSLKPIQHFYQEQLPNDEIENIAQKVARYVLDEIKKKTVARA